MVSQRVVVINDMGLERRERTTSTGTTSRFTVSIKAEPLVHVFDPKTLGMGPAMAIAEHLRERVASIGATASPSTQLARKYAATAFAAGKSYATNRYAGGRIGAMAPNQSPRAFNDSGRFAKSIVAAPTRDNNWVVNVAANRLDPSTFRDGEAGVNRIFVQLRQYVPEFGDASQLLTVPGVRSAIGESIDAIFIRGIGSRYTGNRDFRAQVRRAQLDALRKGFDLLQSLQGG